VNLRWFLMAMVLAAVAPLFARHRSVEAATTALPPWPHEFEGRPLIPVPLPVEERRLLGDFPGSVARFTDGERDILLRWVNQPTRRLHPAEDCYRGWGFDVGAANVHADRDGNRWRCFEAVRDGVKRRVCEQIRDTEGVQFTDVSSWYWDATLQRSQGPWLVVTVAGAQP
jgi:hypothetical protein